MDVKEQSEKSLEDERIINHNAQFFGSREFLNEIGQESMEERNGQWKSTDGNVPDFNCACIHIILDHEGKILEAGNFGANRPEPVGAKSGRVYVLSVPTSMSLENLLKGKKWALKFSM